MIKIEKHSFLYGEISFFSCEGKLVFISLSENPVDEYNNWFKVKSNEIVVNETPQYETLVQAYLSGEKLPFFECDYQGLGTPLQQKVWEALRTIPYGETWTYKQLANFVGKPNAVRAVATAVGKNPILVFNACHRVILANGAFGKYRAGRLWKESLLVLEEHTKNRNVHE